MRLSVDRGSREPPIEQLSPVWPLSGEAVRMKISRLSRMRLLPALLFAALPLGFLLATAIYQLTIAVPEARRTRAETIASFQALRNVSAVEEAVQDAERGQRGYLVTGRNIYLEPYEHARTALPALISQLRGAVQQNGDQQERLLRLQADLTTKMNELESTIAVYRRSGFEAAKAIVDTDAGRTSMDAILADLNAISDTETARLNARSNAAEAAAHRENLAFLSGSLVSALALLTGAILLAYAYGRATASEQTLQATLDSVREGVAAFDPSSRLRAWNEPFVKLLDLGSVRLEHDAPVTIDRDTSAAAADVLGRIGELDATARRTGRPALVT
jgi:CHASE3 domain sensor protein